MKEEERHDRQIRSGDHVGCRCCVGEGFEEHLCEYQAVETGADPLLYLIRGHDLPMRVHEDADHTRSIGGVGDGPTPRSPQVQGRGVLLVALAFALGIGALRSVVVRHATG